MRFFSKSQDRVWVGLEIATLWTLFLVYAGDLPPAVNEAHYLVKAKNFWDPTFCDHDLFAASGKAHTTFYLTFGALTQWVSLEATAWVGRAIGWLMIAFGLCRLCRRLSLPTFYSIPVAVMWLVGIQYGNFAGEWVVGGIEAKVPAYGLVLLGLSELVVRRWSWAWVWLGTAAAFHVLTGGWAVIAAMIAFAWTERVNADPNGTRARFFSLGLVAGGLLSLLGLVPALELTLQASSADSTTAARIYSYTRIRHHLLPGDFPIHWYLRHAVLVIGLVAMVVRIRRNGNKDIQHESTDRLRRLLWFGVGSLGIAAAGLGVGMLPAVAPDLAARLLRYYWFRLSDAIVPLAIATAVMFSIANHRVRQTDQPIKTPMSIWFSCAIVSLATLLLTASIYQRHRLGIPPSASHRLLGVDVNADVSQQRQSFRDWQSVCRWIRLATPENEVFLTPRHQQTFKWYAARAEVVNWKDVPQDAASLLEWDRRFQDVFPQLLGNVPLRSMRVPIGYESLRRYRDQYGVRFMVVDNRIATKNLPLVKLYPVGDQINATYSVYELPYN